MRKEPEDLLIVRFGGVGEFVHALPAMAAIRRSHRTQRITLLTDTAMAPLGLDSPYVDDVVAEDDFHTHQGLKRVTARLRGERFAGVFDLQGGARAERVYHALKPFGAVFASTVRSARWRINPNDLAGLHPVDAALARVAAAGVAPAGEPIPDVRWAVTARRGAPSLRPAHFGLRQPYVVVCPDAPAVDVDGGASPDAPADAIWPIAQFAGLVATLLARDVDVAIAAGPQGRGAARAILAACPGARDVSRADYTQLAALAACASGSFGHAGGTLMPLIAAAGAPTLTLVTSPADAGRGLRGKSIIAMLAPTPEALSASYAADAVCMFTRAQSQREIA